MSRFEFEWDVAKATTNRQKHKVTFDEAASSFDDPNSLIEYDDDHSRDEDRWIAIGISERSRLLTVSYTKRDEKIRIISARRSNQAETGRYTDEA